MMKRAYLFFALLVMLGAVARGQTIAVTQSNASATRNEITADLKWPSSRTLTIMSGGTFHYAAGASFGGSGLEFLQDAGLPAVSLANAGKTIRINLAGNAYEASDAGAGTVTSFAFTSANGITGSVTNATTTPTLSLSLGAITPTTVNGLTFTSNGTGFSVAGGTTSKTLTVSNTLTLAGADSSTLNIGSGGTLGTAAFTAATDYATAAQGTKADNAGAVSGIVKSNGSATFSAAVSGTDYAPATSGMAILKGSGSGGFADAAAGTDYLAPNGSGAALTNVVNSITGTAGQVTASASTGAVTLSLPAAITSVNSVTAASATDLSLAGGTAGSSSVKVTNTTAATNTTSGALQVGSNIGLSGNSGGTSFFGGAIIAGGTLRAGAGSGETLTTGSVDVAADIGIASTQGIVQGGSRIVTFTSGNTGLAGNLTVSGTGTSSFAGPVGVQAAGSVTTGSAGVHAFDTDAWAASRGAMQIHDGTANTYAVAALASDTPSAGQVPTYNADGTVTWENSGPTVVRVTSQFDKTNDPALANITGLSVNVTSGQSYSFEAILYVSTGAGGAGAKAAIAGTATATAIRYSGIGYTASALNVTNVTSLGSAVANATSSFLQIRINGTITVNAGGTLTVQFAQNTSNANASSVLTGSTFSVQPVP